MSDETEQGETNPGIHNEPQTRTTQQKGTNVVFKTSIDIYLVSTRTQEENPTKASRTSYTGTRAAPEFTFCSTQTRTGRTLFPFKICIH